MRRFLCVAVFLSMGSVAAAVVTDVEDFTSNDLNPPPGFWSIDSNAFTNLPQPTVPSTGWTTPGSGLHYTKTDPNDPLTIDPNDPNDLNGARVFASPPIGNEPLGFAWSGGGDWPVPTVPATFTIHIDDPDTIAHYTAPPDGFDPNSANFDPFRMNGTSFVANARILNKESGFDPNDPSNGGLVPVVTYQDAGSVSAAAIGNNLFNFGGLLQHTDITSSLDLIYELTAGQLTAKMVGDGTTTVTTTQAVPALENGDRIWFDFYFSRDGLQVEPTFPAGKRPVQADFLIESITTTTSMFVPEPSTLVLTAVGLIGLALLGRWRQ